MPSGPRIRSNNVFGLTTDNPLTAGATSFNSTSLFLLPAVSSAHAVIVLDPKRVNGEPEIVIVTAHTALATSATISRAAYGTTARSHPVNTAWAHVVVTDDMIPIVTSGTRPSDPFEGQIIYETDTHRPVHRDNTQWLPGGPVSVVTSSTRPVNPYDGQTIYETDTDMKMTWNGTLWLPQTPRIDTTGTLPSGSGLGAGPTLVGTINISSVTYRSLHTPYVQLLHNGSVTNDQFEVGLYDGATTAGTLLRAIRIHINSGIVLQDYLVPCDPVTVAAGAAKTYTLWASRTSGGGTYTIVSDPRYTTFHLRREALG